MAIRNVSRAAMKMYRARPTEMSLVSAIEDSCSVWIDGIIIDPTKEEVPNMITQEKKMEIFELYDLLKSVPQTQDPVKVTSSIA